MQLAWLADAETGEDLAVNPDHVATLTAAGSWRARDTPHVTSSMHATRECTAGSFSR